MCVAFRPKIFYQIFINFSFFPFFIIFCFHHPAVIVHEVILCFLLCSSGFRNSLRSSSHLLLGLPTCLRVSMLLSSPGCQSKTLLVHLFSGREAILLAIRHFSLQCVSIQHGIFCFSIRSSASLVLLLMYSIQSSSFSVESISSSASSWKDTSLSLSLFEF